MVIKLYVASSTESSGLKVYDNKICVKPLNIFGSRIHPCKTPWELVNSIKTLKLSCV